MTIIVTGGAGFIGSNFIYHMLGKYPDMDVISFGPTIIGAHTVEEKVSVYSVEKFYGMLTQMLEELA